MDPELMRKIDDLGQKIDENTKQLNRLRLYFLWTLIISITVVVLPIIGLIFAIPKFLGLYQDIGL